MASLSKKQKKVISKIDIDKKYLLSEAIDLVKSNATSKFDESFEIALNLGIDPKHSDQIVRGVVTLPNGTGKTLRVGVFVPNERIKEAEEAGADVFGNEDLIEDIKKGIINFDKCIATPDMMPKVGSLGKILGSKGMMPNPKLGTVTEDIAGAIKNIKNGQVEYRAEKNGIVHAGVAKTSFSKENIEENIICFVSAINSAKPSGAKGTYLKNISVCSTMGIGIKLDIQNLLQKL